MEYATAGLSNRMFVSRYLTVLPSPERLGEFLREDRERIEVAVGRKSTSRSVGSKSKTAPKAPGTLGAAVRRKAPRTARGKG